MKYIFAFLAAAMLIYSSSCKKCFVCTNECHICAKQDTGNLVLTKLHCADSFENNAAYKLQLQIDSLDNFVCTLTQNTVEREFCTEAENVEWFKFYHESNGVKCVEKK
jgi:hypothetical protein